MSRSKISTTRIAEICGVSQGTVDRALNNRKGISQETKERILTVAKEYGYRPNIHARSIAGGKTQLIGVVVFDLDNQYFCDLLTSIEQLCASMNYSTVVMFTNKDYQKEIECIKNLYHMAVDGIALCPVNSGEEYENFLLSLNIPIVTFGNKLDRLPYVGIDNALAIREVVEYVAAKGYEKLIYVKPALKEKNTYAQSERLTAFIAACQAMEMAYSVVRLSGVEAEVDCKKRSAFICPTDLYAIKLLPIAQKYHVGIIGFDNIRLIDTLELPLDSIAYDVAATAKAIFRFIAEGMPIPAPIGHMLICRGSV